jgi:superfamily I DNA/RNA helicase
MKERLKKLIHSKSTINKVTISTFHAFGHSVLKEYVHDTERDTVFSIIDEDEKRHILQHKKICDKKQVRAVSEAITEAKQHIKTVNEINDKELAKQFAAYNETLRSQNTFDLDDLIYQTVLLLVNDSEIRRSYQDKYKWILIDEYQDINYVQYMLIKQLLNESSVNLFAIGDQNQAIYGFRGADVSFIKTFAEDYPDAAVYQLEKSYRCSDRILKASDQVIQQDSANEGCLEGIDKGVKITITSQKTDKSEAEFIARTIEDMIGGLRFFSIDSQVTEGHHDPAISSLSDFVVLCRINRQMKAIEKAFNDHSIPYQIIGDTPFFKQEPIKSILNVLKLSINPDNNMLKDLLVSKSIVATSPITDTLKQIRDKIKVKDKLAVIIDLYFANQKLEKKSQLNELLDIGANWGEKTEQFILFTDLGGSIDTYKPDTETVTIMTIHASKGLEFPCVFIAGCEDGLLPYFLIENQKSDYEEEKRLLYVGMTRAKKHLFLSYTEKRFIFGKEHFLKRSPFLDTIEDELIRVAKTEFKQKEKAKSVQLNLFE